MKQFCLIFLFFIFVLPSFSQEVETAGHAATMLNLWESMSEEQKNTVIKNFEDSLSISFFNHNLNMLNENERWKFRKFITENYKENEYDEFLNDFNNLKNKEKSVAEIFLAMNEIEKESIKNLIVNENKYYSGRKQLKFGNIMGGVSLCMSVIIFASLYDDIQYSEDALLLGIMIMPFATSFIVSIPFTITGAIKTSKYKKYKPTIAFSPNSVRFVMNF